MTGALALAFFLLCGGAFLITALLRRHRRARLMAAMLPEEKRKLLAASVPHYQHLTAGERQKLEGLVQVFLHEKNFEACGDLPEITEEMRITIAGNACLMLVGRPVTEPFPRLRSILLYPAAFSIPERKLHPYADPLFPEDASEGGARLGESWDSGTIILSWADVMHGQAIPEDGFNLVIHEFAHQIDASSGKTDGVPLLDRSDDYKTWSEVFLNAYERHHDELEAGRDTLLDEYAATAPEEFFAVASEAFFEVPKGLRNNYPNLYRELVSFYRIDPTLW